MFCEHPIRDAPLNLAQDKGRVTGFVQRLPAFDKGFGIEVFRNFGLRFIRR